MIDLGLQKEKGKLINVREDASLGIEDAWHQHKESGHLIGRHLEKRRGHVH